MEKARIIPLVDFHSTERGACFWTFTDWSLFSLPSCSPSTGGLRHVGWAAKREMSKIEKRSGGREGSGREPGDKQAEGPPPLRQHIWNIKRKYKWDTHAWTSSVFHKETVPVCPQQTCYVLRGCATLATKHNALHKSNLEESRDKFNLRMMLRK